MKKQPKPRLRSISRMVQDSRNAKQDQPIFTHDAQALYAAGIISFTGTYNNQSTYVMTKGDHFSAPVRDAIEICKDAGGKL